MSANRPALLAMSLLLSAAVFAVAEGPREPSEASQGAAKPTASPAQRPALEVGHPTFVSPHFAPIAVHRDRVFVVNTPADTVDVIDRQSREIVARISVGVDPVSIAIRPDGGEVWVSNHVSDSVSVIDNDATSPTYLQVVATVQEFDPRTRATRFDEPVGIAFAGNDKAYVALSSANQIAVVDVPTRSVSKRLTIPAQDPRAIVVRGDRLYVTPFESNNKTQLSGGAKGDIDGDLVTFDAWEHSIRVNNVLSLGHVTDIVKHPDVPDRDLFVFDTNTDELVETVDSLGTLLYGLAVDSKGAVFIAQTDARNEVNGRAGTKQHGINELQNRAFLNQITRVEFNAESPAATEFLSLEPAPPAHPEPGQTLATPFAVQVSEDDSTLFVSAAGSDKLVTVDAKSGEVLGRIAVGAVPRGVALEHGGDGRANTAWVYNAVANTVSVVDVSDATDLKIADFVRLEDPTHPRVKLGRTWFNDADASSTGTFSCASCHPDGHTDQLLWVLKTPIVSGGDQIMPRSTMPIRGLRDTAPFHWDGVPGDPYGGNNSANVHGSSPPNSDIDDPTSTTRHLIDGGLATTMHLDGDPTINDEGKVGKLTAAERDDMALFLLSVPFPPSQRRAFDNVLSEDARRGFELFHVSGDLDPSKTRTNVCGDCHRMPFLVSTNTPGTGMDAPTWRGAYDRFLILPQGRLNMIEFPFYRSVAERGQSEEEIWRFSWGGRPRFNAIWNMVVEGSTGFSGSFARQATLNTDTAADAWTQDLLAVLEQAAREGGVVLDADGVMIDGDQGTPVALQFDPNIRGGAYVEKQGERRTLTRRELTSLAEKGRFVGTFTGRHGAKDDVEHPQPAIWTLGPIERQRGRQDFPILHSGKRAMTVSGRHLDRNAFVYVNGRRATGVVSLEPNEHVTIELEALPPEGLHFLQLQNPDGMFSNDFIFHVAKDEEAAAALKRKHQREYAAPIDRLARAIVLGDVEAARRFLRRNPARLDAPRPQGGSTPLAEASLHGRLEIVRLLLELGADVHARNNDGNTPLHVAAFLCRKQIVELLLENGASATRENERGETPIDVVSSEWNPSLAGFYKAVGAAVGVAIDLERVQDERPEVASLMRQRGE